MPKRKSFATRVKSAARKRAAPSSSRATPKHVASASGPPARRTARARTAGSAAPATPVVGASSVTRPPTSNLQPPISNPHSPVSNKPQAEPDPGYVAVGRVLGPFGLKGELRVQALTDNEDRFKPKAKLWAGQQPVSIAKARAAQGHLYLTFKGFPDRDSTDKFRHALLQIPESDLPPLPDGEYYRFQLIGLTVVGRDGAILGTLDEIIETGANDVYRVHPADGADVLLPALVDVVVSVDLAAKQMVVDPPDWR